jgi:hypothetical protein
MNQFPCRKDMSRYAQQSAYLQIALIGITVTQNHAYGFEDDPSVQHE